MWRGFKFTAHHELWSDQFLSPTRVRKTPLEIEVMISVLGVKGTKAMHHFQISRSRAHRVSPYFATSR
jgi:hypothetical protein